MLKEAFAYLVGLRPTQIYNVDGHDYSNETLHRIDAPKDAPSQITVNSLDSIVNLVKKEIDSIGRVLFVRVQSPTQVDVFTTYTEDFSRFNLYAAKCAVPGFREGFNSYEAAMISLRSQYKPNEGVTYLLDLLARITDENSVKTNDNGATQSVETRKGIQLSGKEKVNPRVKLIPFRTFLEIEQPESEFLLRLDDKGNVGLFEADGGMWQIEARKRIHDYLLTELWDLVNTERITIMI